MSGAIGLNVGCHAILEYLLIIHLRKKVAAWRKVSATFLEGGVGVENELRDGQCSAMEGVFK